MPFETEVSISRHLIHATSGFLVAVLLMSPLIAVADSRGIDLSDSDDKSYGIAYNVAKIGWHVNADTESNIDGDNSYPSVGLRTDAIIMGLLVCNVLASFAGCVLIAIHSDTTPDKHCH